MLSVDYCLEHIIYVQNSVPSGSGKFDPCNLDGMWHK
jgi:hypothetical protein